MNAPDRAETGPLWKACEFCGADNWVIRAAIVGCFSCKALWDLVNGQWILAEPPRENPCPPDVCPLCYHRLDDPAHARCQEERAQNKYS